MEKALKYNYLIDPDDVREVIPDFTGQEVIGLDTETFHDAESGQNQLSLLQLASPGGRVVVIDALAAGIEVVRPLIDDPRVIVAAHNARFDEGVLRQAGFDPAGFVDTLKLSRRTLTLESHSLAAVASHLFDLRLDKTYQRSDWRRRPLSRDQLYYAALDAVVALRLFRELADRLQQQGRWPTELRRATLRRPAELAAESHGAHGDAPLRRSRLDLRPLTSAEQRVVRRLAAWRQQQASHEKVPLYLICPDQTLHHLAILNPRSIDQLPAVYGLGETRITRYGRMILDCLARPEPA